MANDGSIRLLPLDYVVAAVVLCACAVSLLLTFRSADGEPLVYITTQSDEYVYALTDAVTLTLSGPVGETEIAITDGAVRVVRSPGREQICVNKEEISRHGEWLICLPNQIFIRIAAAAADSVDSYSY